ncbi:MAG: NAD-dependent epimerase/dehydratase family protein [Curtobacterium sp.]
MVRVMLTGATGYVGSATVHALQRAGHDVIAVVRDASTDRARLVADTGASLVTADTTDVSTVLPHLDGVDVLLHTVPSDGEDGDRTLFASLADRDDAPHVVYVTGCSAFGRHRYAVLTEDTPTDPDHPRARLEKTLQESELRHTIVRPAFVYGGDNRSSLLGRWLDEAADRSGAFYGDTSKTWSWVHIDDLADALTAIVDRVGAVSGELFLLADDGAQRAVDTFAACRRAFGDATPVPLAPISEEAPLFQVFDRDEVIDNTHARTVLGWQPAGPSLAEVVQMAAAR